jgi:NAD(P)-dependent dehydrogenase (short-subunit alcohol dehydrogenase family)
MGNNIPVVLTGTLNNNSLEGKGAIVTGAGTGIGFEAARSLAYLGAKVLIAEINEYGQRAAEKINEELGKEVVFFIRTDVGDEQDIKMLKDFAKNSLGKVDIIINNATGFKGGY